MIYSTDRAPESAATIPVTNGLAAETPVIILTYVMKNPSPKNPITNLVLYWFLFSVHNLNNQIRHGNTSRQKTNYLDLILQRNLHVILKSDIDSLAHNVSF